MSQTKSFSADSVKLHVGTTPDALSGNMTVLMKTTKTYTNGSILASGSSYTVTREWGKTAVDFGWATDVNKILSIDPTPISTLTPAAAAATEGGVTTNTASQSWYDTGGSGGPLWVMETAESQLMTTLADRNIDVNRIIHIDPINGSDTADGTRTAPKRTRIVANWTAGAVTTLQAYDLCLLNRNGSTYNHTGGTDFDIGTNQHVGSYGQLNAPRPIIRSQGTGAYVVGIVAGNSCSISDVDIIASDVTNRSGVFIAGGSSGSARDLCDIMLSNVRITGVKTTGSTLRAGVRIANNNYTLASNQSTPYNPAYDIDLVNVDVEGCDYHGFHIAGPTGKLVNGVWRGIRYTGCKSIGNNVRYDGHGFSQFAMGTTRDNLVGYTNTSGFIYYCTVASVFGNTSTGGGSGCTTVPDVAAIYQRVPSPVQVYFLRKNTTTPTTPEFGEFGFDSATQRIYINVGVALPASATAGWNLDACTDTGNGTLYNRVFAKGNLWPGATAVNEGHGIAFDDFTSNSLVINSECINNAGLGVSFNRGYGNRVFNSRLYDNALGPLGGVGVGHRVWGNYAKGSGLSAGGVSSKGMVSFIPPVYPFRDQPVVVGGWNQLEYTGADPTAFLVCGGADFNAIAVQFLHSTVTPGVARIAGFGSAAGEGGFVLPRGIELVETGNTRKMISRNFQGY